MRATKLFAFLALCLVLALTGCDSGGGGGGNNGGDTTAFDTDYNTITGGSSKYLVRDIVGRTDPPISEFSTTSEGIKFKESDIQFEIKITIFLNADNKFASKEGGTIGGESMGNFEYTGTWSREGSTVTMIATKEKDLDKQTVKDVSITYKATISNDESTLTDTEVHGDAGGMFIYTKQ